MYSYLTQDWSGLETQDWSGLERGHYSSRTQINAISHIFSLVSLKYDVTDAILQDIEKNESAIPQESFV